MIGSDELLGSWIGQTGQLGGGHDSGGGNRVRWRQSEDEPRDSSSSSPMLPSIGSIGSMSTAMSGVDRQQSRPGFEHTQQQHLVPTVDLTSVSADSEDTSEANEAIVLTARRRTADQFLSPVEAVPPKHNIQLKSTATHNTTAATTLTTSATASDKLFAQFATPRSKNGFLPIDYSSETSTANDDLSGDERPNDPLAQSWDAATEARSDPQQQRQQQQQPQQPLQPSPASVGQPPTRFSVTVDGADDDDVGGGGDVDAGERPATTMSRVTFPGLTSPISTTSTPAHIRRRSNPCVEPRRASTNELTAMLAPLSGSDTDARRRGSGSFPTPVFPTPQHDLARGRIGAQETHVWAARVDTTNYSSNRRPVGRRGPRLPADGRSSTHRPCTDI